jgi:hypothetical protein
MALIAVEQAIVDGPSCPFAAMRQKSGRFRRETNIDRAAVTAAALTAAAE